MMYFIMYFMVVFDKVTDLAIFRTIAVFAPKNEYYQVTEIIRFILYNLLIIVFIQMQISLYVNFKMSKY